MKLLKPSWVHHDDKPIFSVDVHQECLKFATGGQGVDSGRVVIWNLLPVLSDKAEQDDSVPKMLCRMDNHLACVNCVRWSQNGHMLASGSDDKLIMIWRKAKGASGVFGTGGIQNNAESWKCAFTLRGHSGDVLDLAWSPQDRWLASCSIDNTIIVWDVQAFPAMVAMLKGHTGLVKGVAWDPVGKFLASQSDDRSVKIWKTYDWTCNNTITEPFEECGGTTHILRLSWSPDGQYLVSAHAMNGGGPTAQIIEREGWKCDKDFVGHRKAVTCVRFHNSILKRQAAKSNKPQQYCCLAVGSRDRSLSVWMTALQRPLVVIHELFNDSILDLSWGPAKYILMACSGDGSIACLQFSEAELGTPLSEEDKNSLYQRIYGKVATLENGGNDCADVLIENSELLHVTKQKISPPSLSLATNHNNNLLKSAPATVPPAATPNTNSFVATVETAYATPTKAINKQLETRTADGKRRITPVFIPLNQDLCEAATPELSSSSRPMAGITTTTTTVSSSNIHAIETSTSPAVSTATVVVNRSEETSSSKVSATGNSATAATETEEVHLDPRLTKCTASSPNSSTIGGPKLKPLGVNKTALKSFPYEDHSSNTGASAAVRDALGVTPATPHQASTAGPKLNITPSSTCEFQKSALDHRIHVRNGAVQTSTGPLAKVTAYWLNMGVEQLWEVYVGSPIVNLNFCRKYAMLCSLDGTMRLLDMRSGVVVLPVITLSTAAIQCAFCPDGNLVGVITDCGILRVWNIVEERVTLATTCAEIFGKFGAVLQFNITEHGVPLVLFANGNSYTYSQRMQSWLVLSTKDPIMRHGLQTTMPKAFQKDYRCYPLISIQASTNTFATTLYSAIELNTNNWQASAKITFIENQIKLCEAINSPDELKHWYSMLAYHLAISGTEQRLRLLLNDLLDTAGDYADHSMAAKRTVLNIPKLELLELVLNVLKLHLKWQRIYMEYYELFVDIKGEQTAAAAVTEQTSMDAVATGNPLSVADAQQMGSATEQQQMDVGT